MKVSSMLAVAAALGVAVPAGAQGVPDSLPDGVSRLMIADGRSVYQGPGLCSVCHGLDATGLESLGNDLTDHEWTHGDGSYDAIINTLKKGVWAQSGTAMPHQKATALNDRQLRAVAAYVWSLSRMKRPTEQ